MERGLFRSFINKCFAMEIGKVHDWRHLIWGLVIKKIMAKKVKLVFVNVIDFFHNPEHFILLDINKKYYYHFELL